VSETPIRDESDRLRESSAQDANAESKPGWLARLLARVGISGEPEDAREIIEEALENEEITAQSFSPQERLMLGNLLRFGELRVEDVIVPRADITAIENNATLAELLQVFQDAGHSRIPVYEGTLDDPRGMIHIKDLMAWITAQATSGGKSAASKANNGKKPSRSKQQVLHLGKVDLSCSVADAHIRREVLFVPPSMSGLDLLLRMQTTRIHLALVVDEYGGTDGLVSIEDLVEEIVGEIEDEHDQSDIPLIVEDEGTVLIADARAQIEELEERLGTMLLSPEREEDIDTLGGLVFVLAGRVPVRGELVRHESGLEFEVLDADARRIKKLKIHRSRAADKA